MSSDTTPKQPVAYAGTGSAIDNYLSPKPVDSKEEKKWQAFDYKNPQHKRILALLHTMGWTKEVNGKTVGNMENFAHWLKTKSPVNKPLPEMTKEETSRVIYAFDKVVKHFFS